MIETLELTLIQCESHVLTIIHRAVVALATAVASVKYRLIQVGNFPTDLPFVCGLDVLVNSAI